MTEEDLGGMRISRLLPSMALPMILAQLVNGLYSIVDRIYLGHIPLSGSLVLTGVGVTYPAVLLIASFSRLVGNGGGPLAAMRLGQRKKEAADEILSNSVSALIILSVLLMAFFYAFKRPLLRLFGASSLTMPSADGYLSVYLLGTPFILLTLGLTPFLTAEGRTGKAMAAVVTGALLNMILDPLFIFALGLGAQGAAAATVISQTASALFVLRLLTRREGGLRVVPGLMRPRKKVLIPVLKLGASPFIMGVTEAAISFVFNSRLQALGGDLAVGTMAILSSVMSFSSMPVTGFNQALVPVISFNFGSGSDERVKEAFRFSAALELIYTLLVSLVSLSIPGAIISLFTSDPELISFASPCLRLFLIGYSVFGLQCASQNAFLGLGQAGISMFFAVFRKVILLIPLVYLLSSTPLGMNGVFLAESIADSVSALVTFTVFCLRLNFILGRGAPASA